MRRPGGETAGPPLLHGIFPSGGGALQIPPLRFAALGMTRVGRLRSVGVATWMDGFRSGYSAATADPLRFAPVGMTRVGRLRSGRVATWMDGVGSSNSRGNCRSHHHASLRSE
jgi:hypothetical protein